MGGETNHSGASGWDSSEALQPDLGLVLKVSYLTVCVLGLIINILLLAIIIGRRAHRNPRNLFILNLAVSGLLTVTVTLPPTLSQCLSAGRWFLGLTACKVVPTIQGTNTLVITGTISAIAATRWLGITQNMEFSRKCILLINLTIWLSSFLITSPILAFQSLEEIHILDTSFTMCVENWPHIVMKSGFTMMILFSQYILPVIVLPGFYYNILKFLQLNQESQELETKKLKKLTLILTCLAVVFAVSSLPLNIFFTMTDLGLVFISDVQVYYFSLGLCHLVSMSSCISNPILYGWLQA